MYQRMSGAIDAEFVPVASPEDPPAPPEAPAAPSAEPLSVSALLERLRKLNWKSDDLLLAAILYFALRDSGDRELLWIAAALFLSGAF